VLPRKEDEPDDGDGDDGSPSLPTATPRPSPPSSTSALGDFPTMETSVVVSLSMVSEVVTTVASVVVAVVPPGGASSTMELLAVMRGWDRKFQRRMGVGTYTCEDAVRRSEATILGTVMTARTRGKISSVDE
jgi:hypothetical protein